MNGFEDQDGDAIYASVYRRRVNAMRNAGPDEKVMRNNVSARKHQLIALINKFEEGDAVDPKQIDLLGVQIAANVATANELRAGVPILAMAS